MNLSQNKKNCSYCFSQLYHVMMLTLRITKPLILFLKGLKMLQWQEKLFLTQEKNNLKKIQPLVMKITQYFTYCFIKEMSIFCEVQNHWSHSYTCNFLPEPCFSFCGIYF